MTDVPPTPPPAPGPYPPQPPQQPQPGWAPPPTGYPPQPGYPTQPGYPPQPGYAQPGWTQVGYGYGAGGPQLQQISGLANAVTVFVGIASVLAAFGALALLSRASLIDDPTASFADLVAADDRVGGSVGFFSLSFIVTGILWIVWQYRYAKNLTALGRPLDGGAGRAIWGWFIPIANYFISPNQLFRAAKESDRARGGTGTAPGTLVPWWIAFGLGSLLWAVSTTLRPGADELASVDDFRTADQIGAFGLLLFVVAGVLAALTVRACTARQVGPATAPAPAPPPTTF